ncbi:HDOD domain-containing protein [Vibrio sp. Y2-5]|uniref:HDOD domain-containing protein n=1 Tax=Vibrio sp. Y2-5 TaxID=2743977 RepID=UPI0016602167|nr:HDOD domain-containing protein [Vibrio sp. Y2-5]MBD0787855.1 HDOD domain-containing protein [Vibrio sp. Y2-5]
MNQEALLSRFNELPRIESIQQELLNMVNSENLNFSELARKMSMDQVLSARVLRMANSAQFGGAHGVSTINEAIIRVGSGAVRTLISSSVVSGVFPKLETLNIKDYWANTFEIAMIASKLARAARLDPNEAFTTGVLHNIGELMIHALEPEIASQIKYRADHGEELIAVQKELLDTDAQELGARLAREWQFPSDMADAIENVNHPGKATEAKRLACVLFLAREIHKRWDSLFDEREKRAFLTRHPAAKALALSSDVYIEIDRVRGHGVELAHQLF